MLTKKKRGFVIWKKDIPDDFKAINSDFSDRLPNVIIEDNKTASGKQEELMCKKRILIAQRLNIDLTLFLLNHQYTSIKTALTV